MTTVFLCYASEDKPLAEAVQLALVTGGYSVFFDQDSLHAGDDYNGRILRAIRECDAFIFLATSQSIAEGKYTLSELRFIRQRWPTPAGRVLAVNVSKLPPGVLPPYLTAATVLETHGNIAAEVRAAVEVMLDRQVSVDRLTSQVQQGRRRKTYYAAAAIGMLTLAVGFGYLAFPRVQLAILGASIHLSDFKKVWVREGGALHVADGWRHVVVAVDDVKVKNRIAFVSLRHHDSTTSQQRAVTLDAPKTVVINDREYLLQVHDFSDVEIGADQAELTVSLK